MIAVVDITGLVLAGGRGSRMGGLDKGLQPFLGIPLAVHALRRLSPQVATVAISANRHLAAYQALGVPVWPDALPDHPGPLAGFLAGLEHCATPCLATVPCDSPRLPDDLVQRLAAALHGESAELAMAATHEDGSLRLQPVFCLMRREVLPGLAAFVGSGRRRVDAWTATLRTAVVRFDDAGAFANANTAEELERLARDD